MFLIFWTISMHLIEQIDYKVFHIVFLVFTEYKRYLFWASIAKVPGSNEGTKLREKVKQL